MYRDVATVRAGAASYTYADDEESATKRLVSPARTRRFAGPPSRPPSRSLSVGVSRGVIGMGRGFGRYCVMPDAPATLPAPRAPAGGRAARGQAELDVRDAAAVADAFRRGAMRNLATPGRRGSVVDLPASGRLLMTGDLHDHTVNFRRVVKLADLDGEGERRLILHELIHGPTLVNGMDLSVTMLARSAWLKIRYGERVHILQSNHELAQLMGEHISKSGESVVEAFNDGVAYLYGGRSDQVMDAMREWLRSLPLAVRCGNGIMCAHSLPDARRLGAFDPAVLERLPSDEDLAGPGGAAHAMVWGRRLTAKVEDTLAAAWGVELFVLGHQPAEFGHETQGERVLILASDHGHGVALPLDLSRRYTRDELEEALRPLAGVRVEG